MLKYKLFSLSPHKERTCSKHWIAYEILLRLVHIEIKERMILLLSFLLEMLTICLRINILIKILFLWNFLLRLLLLWCLWFKDRPRSLIFFKNHSCCRRSYSNNLCRSLNSHFISNNKFNNSDPLLFCNCHILVTSLSKSHSFYLIT